MDLLLVSLLTTGHLLSPLVTCASAAWPQQPERGEISSETGNNNLHWVVLISLPMYSLEQPNKKVISKIRTWVMIYRSSHEKEKVRTIIIATTGKIGEKRSRGRHQLIKILDSLSTWTEPLQTTNDDMICGAMISNACDRQDLTRWDVDNLLGTQKPWLIESNPFIPPFWGICWFDFLSY